MRILVSLLALCALAGPAVAQPKKAAKITYDDHVLPIFKDKCVSCHSQDKKRGGLVLNNYTKVMEGSSSGAVVKPGDPDGSVLYRVTAHLQEPNMPPKGPMIAKESLAVLRQWIANGAPENSGSKIVARPKVDFTLSKIVKGRPSGPPPMPPATLRLEPVVLTARPTAVLAMASSPWAPLVAIGGQKQVLLYHSDTLDLLGVLPFPEGVPQVLKFSRNGSLLLAGGGHPGKSGRVVVWSVTKGERLFEVGDETDCVLAADVSPDQTRVALAGPGKVVRIYGTRDGKLVHEIRKHTDWVTALEYSPDGVLLATGDRNGGLFVWEAFVAREYFALRGHTGAITEISWRLDSNLVASSSEDSTVRLYEMENGNQVRSWGAHAAGALSVRYALDGNLVTAGRDRLAKLWNGNGGAIRAFEALPDVAVRSIFSHDAKRVFASDWTGQVRAFNAADGKKVGELTANPPAVKEQFAAASKVLAVRMTAHATLTKTATDARTAALKTTADLAAAQKMVNESGAAIKLAQAKLATAKATADRAKVALTTAQAEVRAKALLAQALQEAAAKVKGAADKARTDTALAQAATRAQGLATQVATESTAAQKALTEATANGRAADAALAKAQQDVTATATAAANAPKQVAALTPALKAAQAREAATKAEADRATADLTQARATLARWQAAQALAAKGR